MHSLLKFLSETSSRLPRQVQFALLFAVLVVALLTAGWVAVTTRRGRRKRAHPRVPLAGPIQVSWKYNPVLQWYSYGRCMDVSTGGLKMELPDPIGISECIRFQAAHVGLAGKASVRYCNPFGRSYLIGVRFRPLSALLLANRIATLQTERLATPPQQ